MNKSDSIVNISKAIVAVMNEVKGIEKSMTVGSGTMSYKGVPDKEVKKIVGDSMAKNGLSILPIGVTPLTKVERWEETYNGQVKQKQSVFTEVTTDYLLIHTSGEYIQLSGYGHGVDTQDKGAGKATTYALKYTLLYAFLVPTGKIDDADMIHSDSNEVPQKKQQKRILPAEDFQRMIEAIKSGKVAISDPVINSFSYDTDQYTKLQSVINEIKNKAKEPALS
jgi:hypothetical protein